MGKPIDVVALVPNGTSIDVVALVVATEAATECGLRSGGTTQRRNITLVDDSGAAVQMTLWGEQAIDQKLVEGMPVVVKGAKKSDYGNFSLSAGCTTQIYTGADAEAVTPRAAEIRRWSETQMPRLLTWSQCGAAPIKTLADVWSETSGLVGQSTDRCGTQEYHTVAPVSVIINANRAPFYRACPTQVSDDRNPGRPRICNKKASPLDPSATGRWICAHGHECVEPVLRWMTDILLIDHSGSLQVNAFDEASEKIFGLKAAEFAKCWDERENDRLARARVEAILDSRQFMQWRMRLKTKKEVRNAPSRALVSVVEVMPVDFVQR